jgi:hypothetical protein
MRAPICTSGSFSSPRTWPARAGRIKPGPVGWTRFQTSLKGDTVGKTAAMAEADRAWMIDTLLALLQTPSPSGRTDAVMQLIGGQRPTTGQ